MKFPLESACISLSDEKNAALWIPNIEMQPGFAFVNLSIRVESDPSFFAFKIWNQADAEAATESELLGDSIKQLARYQLMMAQL